MNTNTTDELSASLVELKRDDVLRLAAARIASGDSPTAVLDSCRHGMTLVGERFQAGDYFLAELLLAAEVFKEVAALLEPHLAAAPASQPAGSIVLATMNGDIHDLGKNVFATLMRVHAFEVHDLGVNVPPEALVERVAEVQPDFVGFSALLTTAFPSMKAAADLLASRGLRDGVKLLVGGGVTTPAVRDFVGADFQTVDANRGVEFCLRAVDSREGRGPGA